jgi:alpha(1,3/1,4) fucosyltransferase
MKLLKPVGLCHFSGVIDFKLSSKIKFGDDNDEYLFNLNRFLKKNFFYLQDINNSNIKSFDKIIFIDIIRPEKILRKLNINCNSKILIMRERNVIMPEMWKKKTLDQYDYVFTYNSEYFKKIKTSAKIVNYLMPRKLEVNKFFYNKNRLFDYCLFGSNKFSYHVDELYSEREKVINFFEKNKNKEFHLYGPDWNKVILKYPILSLISRRLVTIPKKLRVYKGVAKEKIKVLSKYKFSFCYENRKNFKGHISEKIFDVMRAGCIPIYWGPDDVNDYLDQNTYIDASKFKNIKDLFNYTNNLSEKNKKKIKKNIYKYLTKNAKKSFSLEKFSKKISRFII